VVKVRISLKNDIVFLLDVEGHTSTRECAALSVLAVSYANSIIGLGGTEVTVVAPHPGKIHVEILSHAWYRNPSLKGMSDFLRSGLDVVCANAHNEIDVCVEDEYAEKPRMVHKRSE